MTPAKRYVEIFIGPIPCSCAGGPSPARQQKIGMAFALKSAFENDERFEVRTWKLGDDSSYEEGLKLLGEYLRDAGESEIADRLAFAVNSATPSVAVDGKLVWIRDCPDVADLLERFGTAVRRDTS